MTERYVTKAIAITGTTRGIGRLIAEYFLGEGAVVHGIARGSATVSHNNYYHHQGVDVADEIAVRNTFRAIREQHSRLDILVNNAGVEISRPVMWLPLSEGDRVFRTNVLGLLCVSREAARLMRRGGGRIITVGSMLAKIEPVGGAIYSASKVAAQTLTSVLAKEFQPWGITCNTLGVTAIKTGMYETQAQGFLDKTIASLPIPRYATDRDIFNVIDFFASPNSDYITAQTVYLGGLH